MNFQLIDEKETIEEEIQETVNILVVGAGGGGCNAVDSMIKCSIKGVKFIAVNTDVDALKKSLAETKVQIGINITNGHGTGGMPDIGEQAALEDEGRIKEVLRGAHMVFIVAGMGGGTGTGSAPVIARIAKGLGALTVGVVTKPFDFELKQRMRQAEEGIKRLREAIDTLIVIPNQKIFEVIDGKTSFRDAYARANDVLSQGVKGISDIIVEVGDTNIDFADAATVMRDQGEALMSIGIGEGDDRVKAAAAAAIGNPLLGDISINGATKVLIYVSAGDDFSMVDYKEAVELITLDVSPDAHVIAGMHINPELKNKIKITVIAAGFAVIPGEDKEPVMELVKSGVENLSADAYQKMIEKSKKPKNDFLSRRNHYSEDDLETPAVLRYPSSRSSAGTDNAYDFQLKVSSK